MAHLADMGDAPNLPNHYYWDGFYLRIEGGRWYASARLESGWQLRAPHSVPPGLRKKFSKRRRGKMHPGWGHGPAKRR